MKAFRFKKHRMKNFKINVIVIPEEDRSAVVPDGWKYDVPPPPPLNRPRIPRKLFTKVTRPGHKGRVELGFE